MVISLPAKGLTHGEIAAHLAEVYGAEVSKQTITTTLDQPVEGPPQRVRHGASACVTGSKEAYSEDHLRELDQALNCWNAP
jgi:hypothetical protein